MEEHICNSNGRESHSGIPYGEKSFLMIEIIFCDKCEKIVELREC